MMRQSALGDTALYLTTDRVVCAECAGYTARTTGRTRDGIALVPIDAEGVRCWNALGAGAMTCDCGRLSASLASTGEIIIEPAARSTAS